MKFGTRESGPWREGFWTGWPYVWIHLRRLGHAIAQRLFNRRTLTARRRLQVLREVVEATTNGATAVDAMDLMTSRYGTRWASHPEWQTHHQQLDQQFKLLVESGELRKHDHLFQPTGQALRTLDESEKADRKHTANYRIQLLLALLTLVSAVMAAAQAGLLRLPVLLDLTPVAASAARASVTSPATASPWWPASTTTNASAGAQPRASAPIPIVQPGGAKADTSRGAM